MLYITIMTWQPETADAVSKRAAQKLSLTAGRIIGQWTAIEGGRAFRVVEVETLGAHLQSMQPGMTFAKWRLF
jgi:hypothetical protein